MSSGWLASHPRALHHQLHRAAPPRSRLTVVEAVVLIHGGHRVLAPYNPTDRLLIGACQLRLDPVALALIGKQTSRQWARAPLSTDTCTPRSTDRARAALTVLRRAVRVCKHCLELRSSREYEEPGGV